MKTTKNSSLKPVLKEFYGKSLTTFFITVRIEDDKSSAESAKHFAEAKIGTKRLLDHYRMIGRDIGGDRLIIQRDFSGAVLWFSHEDDKVKPVPIANSLAGFLAICKAIQEYERDLQAKLRTSPKFFVALSHVMGVIATHNKGMVPVFWTDGFMF
jgi:hypothetical protein